MHDNYLLWQITSIILKLKFSSLNITILKNEKIRNKVNIKEIVSNILTSKEIFVNLEKYKIKIPNNIINNLNNIINYYSIIEKTDNINELILNATYLEKYLEILLEELNSLVKEYV